MKAFTNDIAAAVACGTVAVTVLGLVLWRRQRAEDTDEDEIDFGNTAAHRLKILSDYVTTSVEQLQLDIAKLRDVRPCYSLDEFKQQFGRHLIEIDERITKLMISVDGIELGKDEELRQQRKAIIWRINVLADELLQITQEAPSTSTEEPSPEGPQTVPTQATEGQRDTE